MKKYSGYDCLVVDEFGYTTVEPSQSDLFFLLIHKRYMKTSTIITTNLGIGDWQRYLGRGEMVSALIGRLKDNGHIVNFKNCSSIRSEADED